MTNSLPISSVLVANRGEIARRVFATARALGVSTVAVYSTADAGLPYVGEADAAVELPGAAPGETYLRGELVIEAARRAGADAVHPGYGFLSENAGFAQAVLDAGLTWIGPPVAAIAAMGSKIEAKKLMAAAGVPVLAELTPESVTAEDLPVLVKASAGGGGRGMRVVHRLEKLAGEIEAASAEAESAFGDGTVFCERYLATGRHIEVQVLADRHGTVWAVGERECSIQRRHQKVVEESPSPLVERVPGMRESLFTAARAAAEAIGYVGAGTVEFLADQNGNFFFLEMNTRLQVEHPVTESVTGLDLVALQFAIADGAALPPEPPVAVGHSIEVRLYAEDPAQDWLPQTGRLHRFAVGRVRSEFAPGGPRQNSPWLRVDSGVVDGSEVSPFYDAMLAKVIVWGPSRRAAAGRLARELTAARIHGVRTNRDLLVWVLRHPAFLAGDTDTGFFERYGVGEPLADKQAQELSALAAALGDAALNRQRAKVQGRLPSGWRNVPSQPQRKAYLAGDATYEVAYRLTRDGLETDGGVRLVSARTTSGPGAEVVLEADGVRRSFAVSVHPGLVCVDSSLGPVALTPVARFPDPSRQVAAGSLLAPMPGSVIRVAVAVGDEVSQGQPLLWLEAMKMEHTIAAPADGVVEKLAVEAGQQVEVGAVLAVVRAGEDA
ncbi:Carbamoyl-phosphate synthase L chain ATP- binding protein [Kribbella flavida DSM 17836]|uniref:Carbamoyl-phosphate synthase L chain ATP-binding protein n=1 Tax=Kribbella flavida (strain DSM 17836 / JCM 10339 / NBRC 14399) TaxID=479435 RepID=D2PRR1_KRIFD|nr:biotin carboxylase N-terminal domain-containing protein [Kribbella flavida]ADB29241.1 Carbamoyl-phosphate synthase L chain ATP- binding protein [Kribbella flavida DSM 17836]